MALPTKCTREGFDPNAYKLFVKAGYNPSEPSALGKLPSKDTTRMRRRVELMVSYKEELKAKVHTVVYTKELEEDEESVGSSNHVTIQNKYDSLPQKKIVEEEDAKEYRDVFA